MNEGILDWFRRCVVDARLLLCNKGKFEIRLQFLKPRSMNRLNKSSLGEGSADVVDVVAVDVAVEVGLGTLSCGRSRGRRSCTWWSCRQRRAAPGSGYKYKIRLRSCMLAISKSDTRNPPLSGRTDRVVVICRGLSQTGVHILG